MRRLVPALILTACLAGSLAGCPGGTPTGPAANCPPQTRDIARDSAFTITATDAAGEARAGMAVKVVRTPALPVVACPGKLKDQATSTTNAKGEAEFWNMARGTYAVTVDGKAATPKTIDFGEKATATTFVVGSGAAASPDPDVIAARADRDHQRAKPGLPEAGQASFTIADAAAAAAFLAWVDAPSADLAAVDFAKDRLVALFGQRLTPGCNAGVVFKRGTPAVTWGLVSTPLPPGLNCSPPAPIDGPFWGVAILPADAQPVAGTTALAASAAWLAATPAPSASPSGSPSPAGSPSASPAASASPGTSPSASASPSASPSASATP